jgi:type IV pilus assembly protein PilO
MAIKFEDIPQPWQSVTLAALPVLCAGLVFWFFVYPLTDTSAALSRQVKALHQQNQRNMALAAQRATLQGEIASAQKELDDLRSIVPDDPATSSFVKMVHDTASAAGIHLRTFVAQGAVARNFYTELPYKMRLDGAYYNLVDFFSRLADAPRISNVSGLSMGPPAGGGMGAYQVAKNETVGINAVLTTFYNSPQAPAPAPKRK